MNQLNDASIIATVLSLINTVANIYWSLKLKSVQGNGEIIRNLREQIVEQNAVIKELHRKKNEYKLQYNSLYSHMKKVEGENGAYKRFHKHIDTEPQIPVASV